MPRLSHVLSVLILLGSPTFAAPPQTLAPFFDDEATAIVRLDLTKLDVPKTGSRLLGPIVTQGPPAASLLVIQNWADAIRKAGASEIYFIVGLANIPSPPSVVIPLAAGADSKRIGEILCGGGTEKPPYVWPTCAVVHGAVFAGTPESLERVRRNDPKAMLRAGLAEALAAESRGEIQIALAPTADQRRILEEMIPTLPKELGSGPITVLTQGMKWGVIGVELEPKSMLHVTIQASDAAAAKKLHTFANDALKLAGENAEANPSIAKALGQVELKVADDRLISNLDVDQFAALVRPPITAMRAAAVRSQCVNNLKQIMLAMHNFLDADQSKAFPPAFRADETGKPLLSWRVLILPYLDQNELFKEFQLDEPWDSPHNKALISRMPVVFRCPELDAKSTAAGKTTYLTPRGKGTMFPGATGTKIKDITDGTSNSIAVVEAGPDRAVIWTAPDDWEVEAAIRPETILKAHFGGSNTGFGDGSVRFIRSTVKPEFLNRLLTISGSEVIATDEF